jgi:hypothetical protein
MKTKLLLLGILASLLWAWNCKDDPEIVIDNPTPITSLQVSSESLLLSVGDSLQVEAEPVPADANPAEQPFRWESAGTAVATVSASGLVTAVSAGTTTITVSARQHYKVSRTIPVTVTADPVINPVTLDFEAAFADQIPQILETTTKQIVVTTIHPGVTFTYASNSPGVATVNTTGLVTAVAPGAATITVTGSLTGAATVVKKMPVTVLAAETALNKSAWTAEATSVSEGTVASSLTDNDMTTWWRSSNGLPQGFTVDMHGHKRIDGFYYYNPLEGTGNTHFPKDITMETSINGTDWTQYTYANLANTRTRIVLPLPASVIARYFRVTVTANHGDNNYVYLAEMYAYNSAEPLPPAIQVPSVDINPAANVHEGLRLTSEGQNQARMDYQGDHDAITYLGGGNDPYVFSTPVTKNIRTDLAYIKFEYRSGQAVNGCQIFVFYEGGAHWETDMGYNATGDWTTVTIQLPAEVAQRLVAGSKLRFDLNPAEVQVLRIRNLEIVYDFTTPDPPPAIDPAANAYEGLRLTGDGQQGAYMTYEGDHDVIHYSGGHNDPYVFSTPVTQNINSDLAYIKFEYLSTHVADAEIFVFYAGNGAYWHTGVRYAHATAVWATVVIPLPTVVAQNLVAGSRLRFDPNPNQAHDRLRIKNLQIVYKPAPPPPPPPATGINMERAIAWFYDRMIRGTCYNMNARYEVGDYIDLNGNGCVEGDCSSAVMYAVRWAGADDWGALNTDSMHAWLTAHGFRLISAGAGLIFNAQRGDIFIWGQKGASGGAAGHTGVFVDGDNIIHMTYGCNGICVTNYNATLNANGGNSVYEYLYRYP